MAHWDAEIEVDEMAFIRRKGNAWYLVHNVRLGGKVKQIHLARLGEHPRITEDVVRQVSRTYPTLGVNWPKLREAVESRSQHSHSRPRFVQRLVRSLRTVNLDLADLFPTLLPWSESPESASELITHLRMLRSMVNIKLSQFETVSRPAGISGSSF